MLTRVVYVYTILTLQPSWNSSPPISGCIDAMLPPHRLLRSLHYTAQRNRDDLDNTTSLSCAGAGVRHVKLGDDDHECVYIRTENGWQRGK